ncbi:hypothetical protein CDV31_012795 [Fusarium ambrosium]|uniref:SMP domain-containing protein n=1 Tax=Fusarium ambrosium TaxID=131363 RepID=A0A428T7H4_9HYPO|nr:hypothetical protein CDV31_012795 [Fusarium ambrosium]
MEGDIPQKDELQARAMEGHPITQSEASTIAANESDMTGRGPIKGGTAATAQSIYDRQQNFLEKAGDIARKPIDEITKKDAAEVQSAESRLAGRPVGRGSFSSDVQSVADQNARANGK